MNHKIYLIAATGLLCIISNNSLAQSSGWKRDYLRIENTPLNFFCGELQRKCNDAGYKPIYLNGTIYFKNEKQEGTFDNVKILARRNDDSTLFDKEFILSNTYEGTYSVVSIGPNAPENYFVLSNISKLSGKIDPELNLIKTKNFLDALTRRDDKKEFPNTSNKDNNKITDDSNNCKIPAQKEISVTSYKDIVEFIINRDLAIQKISKCIGNLNQPSTQINLTDIKEKHLQNATTGSSISGNAIREKLFNIISRTNGNVNNANIVDMILIGRGILFAIDGYDSASIKKSSAAAFVWLPIDIAANGAIELSSERGVFVDFSDFIEQSFSSPVKISNVSADVKNPDMVRFSITVEGEAVTTSFYVTPLKKLTEQHNSQYFDLVQGAMVNGHRTLSISGTISRYIPNGSDGWLLLSNDINSHSGGESKYIFMKRDVYVDPIMPKK